MLIIDRFEDDFAIVEATDKNGEITMLKVDKSMVSSDVREGDALIYENGIYHTDTEATEQRRERMLERLRRIKE